MPVLIDAPARSSAPPVSTTVLVLHALRAQLPVGPILLNRDRLLIGSAADCDVQLDVPGVNSQHCTILCGPRRLIVKTWDVRTWINDGPIKEACLREGDRLTIGPVEFQIRRASPDELLHHLPDAPQVHTAAAIAPDLPVVIAAAESHAEVPKKPDVESVSPAAVTAALFADAARLRQELAAELHSVEKQIAAQQVELERLQSEAERASVEVARRQRAAAEAEKTITAALRQEVLLRELQHEVTQSAKAALACESQLISQAQDQQDASAQLVRHQDEIERRERQLVADETAELERLEVRLKQIAEREAELTQREQQQAQRDDNLTKVDRALTALQKELEERAAMLVDSETEFATQRQRIEAELQSLARRESELRKHAIEVEHHAADVATAEHLFEKKQQEVVDREYALAARERHLSLREESLAGREQVCRTTAEELDAHAREIQAELHTLDVCRKELERSAQTFAAKEADVTARLEEVAAREQSVATQLRDWQEFEERQKSERSHAESVAREEHAKQSAWLDEREEMLAARQAAWETAWADLDREWDQCRQEQRRLAAESQALESARQELASAEQTPRGVIPEAAAAEQIDGTALSAATEHERAALDAERAEIAAVRAQLTATEEQLRQQQLGLEQSQQELQTWQHDLSAEQELLVSERQLMTSEQQSFAAEREEFLAERSQLFAAQATDEPLPPPSQFDSLADGASVYQPLEDYGSAFSSEPYQTANDDLRGSTYDSSSGFLEDVPPPDSFAAYEQPAVPDADTYVAPETPAAADDETEAMQLRSTLAEMFGLPLTSTASTASAADAEEESPIAAPAELPFDEPHLPPTLTEQPTYTASKAASNGDSHLADTDPDSISAYMERLLARTRQSGGGSPDSSSPVELNVRPGYQPPASTIAALSAASAREPNVAAAPESGAEAAPVEPVPAVPPRPRQDHEQVRAGISELRQVANLSARNAVAMHSQKKVRQTMQGQVLVLSFSAIVAGVLLSGQVTGTETLGLYGWAAAGLSAIVGFNILRTMTTQNRSHAKPAADSAVTKDAVSEGTTES